MYYLLIFHETSKEKVLQVCEYGESYKQIKSAVHCVYNGKKYATLDRNSFTKAYPDSVSSLHKLIYDRKKHVYICEEPSLQEPKKSVP